MQRKRSDSGFYHVVVKGDGGQIIFECDGDRAFYVKTLAQAVVDHGVKLYAYCLMANHVHLLVQSEALGLSAFMKRLNETHAMYFAKMTGRVGHVFQRPFWSEPIETDAHFLSALRYIHANPEPAGICKASDYQWSSYQAYLSESSFVETGLARDMLGGISQFEEFSASGGSYAKPFKASKLTGHHSYDELVSIAISLLGRDGLNGLRAMPPDERAREIELLSNKGFKAAEIARVTGIGIATVRRALMHQSC